MEGGDMALRLSRLCLYTVGLWPNLKDSRSYEIGSIIVLIVSSIILGYFVLVTQTIQLFLINKDLDVIVNILCTADIPVFTTLIRMIIMRCDPTGLKALVHELYEDWKKPHTHSQYVIMYEHARTGRRIVAGCIGLALGTSNSFLISYLIQMFQQRNTGTERSLPYMSHIPSMTSPWFEITSVLQCIATFSGPIAYTGMTSIFAVFVLHLNGQLSILQEKLDVIVKSDNAKYFQDNVAFFVKRHNEINRFGKLIEKTFNRIFLTQVMSCAVLFCLQGYKFIHIVVSQTMNLPYFHLLYMISYMIFVLVDLYIFCHISEKLREKSVELTESIYNCEWYNLEPKQIHNLMLIMRRAQIPMEVTAGKFCVMSLSLFASIGKTSLGYLSMLLALKERNHAI